MKFSEALANWQAFQSAGRKESTQKYNGEIAAIISNRWLDHNQEIESVTEADIAKFLPLVAHYSGSRLNAVMSALKKIFPVAARKLKMREVKPRERPIINQLQFSRLLTELDSRPRSQAALVVNFLAHTGLRIKEARLLRWSDVRPDGILLPGDFSKNGKPRFIPNVNGIADVLARLKAVSEGEHVLPQASVKTALTSACRATGTPHLSHHDFRHLFATRCIESGVDLPTAARWLGHRDGGALLGKVYFHLHDSHSRKMARQVTI